jgi:hypothetical protein
MVSCQDLGLLLHRIVSHRRFCFPVSVLSTDIPKLEYIVFTCGL